MKDKLSLEDAFEQKLANNTADASGVSAVHSDAGSEAVQALVALGYGNSEALKAVKKVSILENTSVEDVLKQALKNIMF